MKSLDASCDAKHRVTRLTPQNCMQIEVARSVKKELVGPNKPQRKVASSVKKERIDGAAWLQVRRRLEEMIGGANLQTPVKEELLLAKVTEQVKKLIEQEKVDAVDSQKAAKTLTADALQFNVMSGTWTKLGRHGGQSEDAVVASLAKPAAPAAEWPQPTRLRRDNLAKQSGANL